MEDDLHFFCKTRMTNSKQYGRRPQKKKKKDNLNKKGRRPKRNIRNGRRPKKNKMEDNLNKKMEDDLKHNLKINLNWL
jgi:hypothetical protein